MKDTPWNHGLRVTAEADGLVGHAGAVLPRKLADQAGLTAALGPALARAGKFPLVDRGAALVSMAVAIMLGATSMNDITLLARHAPVLGAEPSDTTVRRTLELADPATLDKIARVRVRAHVWKLICATPAGFPWLAVAGKLLDGWLVIDLDATLITARSPAPTFNKKGYGYHPLGAWLANTTESLAMLLRPGNAGSSTVADHIAVLAAAVRQIPARFRSRLLVRVDGAGASHELIAHLLSLAGRRRTVLFTCGWMITEADEQAIRLLPATAWQAAVDQDGTVQENRRVAEVTHLMSRAVGWPAGLRWIVRRTKPSRRQMKNLTAFERSAGWRYSDIDLEITPTALASDVASLLDQLGIDRAHLRPQHGRRGDAGARREPSRPGALAGAGRPPRRGCRPSRTSSTSRRPTSGCPRIRTTSTTSSQRCRSRPPIRKGGPGEQLPTITAPTLLVLGDRDFTTAGHGALMQQLIPGSQLAVLPGTTRMQVTRRADLLLPILARFLDRDPRSTAAPVRSPRGGTPLHS